MNNFLRWLCRTLALVMVLGLVSVAHAQISQKPLLTGSSSVKPNIMIVQDNSGSMAWSYAPENYLSAFTTTFVTATPTMSSDANRLWYDPREKYEPRRNADNSLQANATEANSGTFTFFLCSGALTDPITGCGGGNWLGGTPLTIGGSPLRQISSFTNSAQGWYYRNSTGQWYQAGSKATINLGSNDYIYLPYDTVSVSTTATHYLCTTYNAKGICTATQRYDIPGTSVATTYTWTSARTDCALTTKCTWAEERQNALNWNMYYNNRIEAITTAVGAAFADPKYDNAFRLGYGWINNADGSTASGTTVVRGVRPFTDNASLPAGYKTDKSNFYTFLYGIVPNGSTPLYNAFEDVGNYFQLTTNTGPWAGDPVRGSDSSAHLACRKSNFIILSDGGYNDSPSPSPGNVDNGSALNSGLVGATATKHYNPTTGLTFTYSITPSKTATLVAYPDSDSSSLADMALTYWLADLRPDLPDTAPARTGRPAFWQNHRTVLQRGQCQRGQERHQQHPGRHPEPGRQRRRRVRGGHERLPVNAGRRAQIRATLQHH